MSIAVLHAIDRPHTAPERRVAASTTDTFSSWTSSSHFGCGPFVALHRQARFGTPRSTVDVVRIGSSIEPMTSYDVDLSVPCADLDATGALVVADRVGTGARGDLVVRILGLDETRTIHLGVTNRRPWALRVTGPDRIALWTISEARDDADEVWWVDTRSETVLDRVAVQVDACGEGYLELDASGLLFAIGHGACQEHEIEILDVQGDRLIGRDWSVQAPEGLSAIGAHPETFVTVACDPRPVLRQRDRATGEIVAERIDDALDNATALHPTQHFREGWLVPVMAHDAVALQIVHVSHDLTVRAVGEMSYDSTLGGWVGPGVAIVSSAERLELVRVDL